MIVVDASAAIELALRTPAAAALLDQLDPTAPALVPEGFHVDAYAGMRHAYRAKRIDVSQLSAAVRYLALFPTQRAEVTTLLHAAATLVDEVGAHDVFYILLALERRCGLLTCDRGQARAATRLGVRSLYVAPA